MYPFAQAQGQPRFFKTRRRLPEQEQYNTMMLFLLSIHLKITPKGETCCF